MRSVRKIVTRLLLGFVALSIGVLIYKETRPLPSDRSASQSVGREPKVIAYYFHGNYRCATCLSIERQAKATLDRSFSNDLAAQRLEFRPVNVDEPANRHFLEDFQLQSRALVVALFKDGRQQRWKELPEVWLLVGEESRFHTYVKDEVSQFLQEVR